jgi:hypothetical protein
MIKWNEEKRKALIDCVAGAITGVAAAHIIGCTGTHFYKLKAQFLKMGEKVFFSKQEEHGNKGRSPANKIMPEEQQRIVTFYTSKKCADCQNNIAEVTKCYNKQYKPERSYSAIKNVIINAEITVPKFNRKKGHNRNFEETSKAVIEKWLKTIENAITRFDSNSNVLKAAVSELRRALEKGFNKQTINGHIKSVKDAAKNIKKDEIWKIIDKFKLSKEIH